VYYGATALEARECAASPVVVAGGGNSAGQAAVFLAESGSPVTIVLRGPDLNASMSRYLVDGSRGMTASRYGQARRSRALTATTRSTRSASLAPRATRC
jgi:thioredoxin reductase